MSAPTQANNESVTLIFMASSSRANSRRGGLNNFKSLYLNSFIAESAAASNVNAALLFSPSSKTPAVLPSCAGLKRKAKARVENFRADLSGADEVRPTATRAQSQAIFRLPAQDE